MLKLESTITEYMHLGCGWILYDRKFYVQAIIFFLATGNFGITEWGINKGHAVYPKKKCSEIQIVCFMATIVRLYPYLLRNI